MIKRILRYFLTILCLLLMCAWAMSYRYGLWLTYRDGPGSGVGWSWGVSRGEIYAQKLVGTAADLSGLWMGLVPDGFEWHLVALSSDEWSWRKVFPWPAMDTAAANGSVTVTTTNLEIPLWLISLPVVLVTVWLWYRWVRARRVQAVGFEVEMKPTEQS